MPSSHSCDFDRFLAGFNRRWNDSVSRTVDTNCMGTALFLSGLQRGDRAAHISESSGVLSRCKRTNLVGPGTLLAWEHHPGFEASGKRNRMFVVHHMAIVKEVAPTILVYHRPGSDKRVTVDPIEVADLLDARLFNFALDYRVFAYSSPLLFRSLRRDKSQWPNIPISEVRALLTVSRKEAQKGET